MFVCGGKKTMFLSVVCPRSHIIHGTYDPVSIYTDRCTNVQFSPQIGYIYEFLTFH